MVDIPVLQIQWCKGMINLGLRKFTWISFSFFRHFSLKESLGKDVKWLRKQKEVKINFLNLRLLFNRDD